MPDSEGWGAASSADLVVFIVPIAIWALALLFAAVAVFRTGQFTWAVISDKLLRYLFVFPLGLQGLWAFAGHVFLPEESAAAIGWAPSPFQFEVGVANLGIAIACLYAAFSTYQARAAAVVAAACFLAGAGVGHINDMIVDRNLAPGNAGPIMFTDFLTPIAILVIMLLQPRPAAPLQMAPSVTDDLARARADLERSLQGPPSSGSGLPL